MYCMWNVQASPQHFVKAMGTDCGEGGSLIQQWSISLHQILPAAVGVGGWVR